MGRLTRTDISMAINVLSHPQSGDESDIRKAVADATEAMRELQRYKDLEEQGLLHKAQLKNGTPIYVLQCDWDDNYAVHEECYVYGVTEYLIGEINKDWWLTKEEAEAKLKKLKEGVE